MQIKNKHYKEFLDNGMIRLIDPKEIDTAITKTSTSFSAFICQLYLTGCRPIEALQTQAKDITKQNNYLQINLKASKRGLPRPFLIPFSNKYARIIYNYALTQFPDNYLYHKYRSNTIRTVHFMTKKGIKTKEYTIITNKVYYHFSKAFKDIFQINPYYLRHNRFSSMSQHGASSEDIMFTKGAKSLDSVRPYQHMSLKSSKKISRFIK